MERKFSKVSIITECEIALDKAVEKAEETVRRIKKNKNSRQYIENFSYIRNNIIDWLPDKEGKTVLELNAGYGALTEYLTMHFEMVTVLEETEEQAFINISRNRDKENLTVCIGTPEEMLTKEIKEQFDHIIALELKGDMEQQKAMLKLLYSRLKPEGTIIYAAHNKYGLQCWAEGGKRNEAAMTRQDAQKILSDSGFNDVQFYYPYPGVKYATDIFSDEYLPKVGELTFNTLRLEDGENAIFDEFEMMNEIVKDGKFCEFVNEYLIIAKKEK